MRELAAALTLLTRLPAWRLAHGKTEVPIARTVWAFPLVGMVVGGLGGAAFALCAACGMPAALGAVWALGAMLLVTGALHEDGLADTADGFGGGGTRERKLDIMRDSRIGVFGAAGLMVTLGARGVAIATIAHPAAVAAALAAAGALGRACVLLLVITIRPARPDGLASALGRREPTRLVAGFAIAIVIALVLLPAFTAIRSAAGAVAVSLALGWLAQRQVGGYSGDVLGAVSVLAETVALSLLTIGAGTS
jgi:adenosylcobinamide-GDP ribazoletransferase